MLRYHPRPDCAWWPTDRLNARLAAVLADRPSGNQLPYRSAELLALLHECTTRLARQVAALKTPA